MTMDTHQISQTLARIFSRLENKVVFWYDGEKEFEDSLAEIQVPGVTLVRLDSAGSLEMKIRIEHRDPADPLLLYAPYEEPPPEKNWLFDIQLYACPFHADKASILIRELGLDHPSMQPFIKKRKAFFRNRDRIDRFKKWVNPEDLEEALDLKMLTVLTRADQPDPFAVLMKLMGSFCTDGTVDLEGTSRPWKEIQSLGLENAFWQLMGHTFGYGGGDTRPALMDLVLRIFVTALASNLKTDLPVSLAHFQLPGTSGRMNAAVFVNQWQTHTRHCGEFNRVSRMVANKLHLDAVLSGMAVADLADVMLFDSVEKRIISGIRDQVGAGIETERAWLQEVIKKRLDGYWTRAAMDEEGHPNLFRAAYLALVAAIQMGELRNRYDPWPGYTSPEALAAAYIDELYRFDTLYRHFNEPADRTEQAGWDVLKPLRTAMEDIYSGWFLEHLGMAWGEFLGSGRDLLQHWVLPNFCNQYDFFRRHVRPILSEPVKKRVFVIVSDAFRYECARELTDRINGQFRFKAEITPMLGVVPGYTALGMAALLPHTTLSFKQGTASLLVDGHPAASLEQRAAVLNPVNGTAVRASDLSAMSKDRGREFVKPHQVIYIYHDRIDAVGDKAVSEDNAFEAVRAAIDELTALVRFIINSLNGTRVMITADHGFVFQGKKPAALDKSVLDEIPDGCVKKHKRFIMGTNLGRHGKVFSGSTKDTARTDTEMQFWLPRGTNRFHFSGGARFFHGGAMPQEVLVPVVTISEMKGIHLEKSRVGRVGVSLLGSVKKVVTNIPKFTFIQTDAVSPRMKPRTLKISLRHGNDLISSEETLTFDSDSHVMDERKKTVRLPLKSGQFNNKHTYALVLRHADDDTEYDRVPIMIDIAFANDF
jgi:uncharacterized protein (TIGR02687 family)